HVAVVLEEVVVGGLVRDRADHRRLAGRKLADERLPDGPAPVRDTRQLEARVERALSYEACELAEGRFRLEVARGDPPLDDDLGVRRDLEVHRLAAHELDRLAGQRAGHGVLVDAVRQLRYRGHRDGGRRADHDRGLEILAALAALGPVNALVLGGKELEAETVRRLHVAAIVAYITNAGLEIFRHPVAGRDEWRRIVARCRDRHGELVHSQPLTTDLVGAVDLLLHG